MNNSLIVDGMLSGTGLRDANEGGYVDPEQIGVSAPLRQKLADWLLRYEDAHYHQFEDDERNQQLDEEGIGLARMVRNELPHISVRYFSSAQLREIDF